MVCVSKYSVFEIANLLRAYTVAQFRKVRRCLALCLCGYGLGLCVNLGINLGIQFTIHVLDGRDYLFHPHQLQSHMGTLLWYWVASIGKSVRVAFSFDRSIPLFWYVYAVMLKMSFLASSGIVSKPYDR